MLRLQKLFADHFPIRALWGLLEWPNGIWVRPGGFGSAGGCNPAPAASHPPAAAGISGRFGSAPQSLQLIRSDVQIDLRVLRIEPESSRAR
jgi:hypothetical protein